MLGIPLLYECIKTIFKLLANNINTLPFCLNDTTASLPHLLVVYNAVRSWTGRDRVFLYQMLSVRISQLHSIVQSNTVSGGSRFVSGPCAVSRPRSSILVLWFLVQCLGPVFWSCGLSGPGSSVSVQYLSPVAYYFKSVLPM